MRIDQLTKSSFWTYITIPLLAAQAAALFFSVVFEFFFSQRYATKNEDTEFFLLILKWSTLISFILWQYFSHREAAKENPEARLWWHHTAFWGNIVPFISAFYPCIFVLQTYNALKDSYSQLAGSLPDSWHLSVPVGILFWFLAGFGPIVLALSGVLLALNGTRPQDFSDTTINTIYLAEQSLRITAQIAPIWVIYWIDSLLRRLRLTAL